MVVSRAVGGSSISLAHPFREANMAEPEAQSVASSMRTRSRRQYDLVVFGATGYTGKFVAEELYRLQSSGKENVSWAVAGRNEEKLTAALEGEEREKRERKEGELLKVF